ncbi:hypothetical protein [Paenibacillus sp. SYP-B4298]|uniref:hypothetical protein n=1 Tax=Paenibacillus sp. SYP-B4298 TaxID=2996034 RepID=UPI0022DE34B7|nr:hypothetical protein [Paenibacillus sp. SYP-B4298]
MKAISYLGYTSITIHLFALFIFILGATSAFQRLPDLVESVILVIYGIPSFIVSVLSLIWLKKTEETNFNLLFIMKLILTILLIAGSILWVKNTNYQGWLFERVITDSRQITPDDKYEYNLELVNLFQRNSRARVYLKDIKTNEEIKINLNIKTDKIYGVETLGVRHWIRIELLSDNRYLLHTDLYSLPQESFEINIAERKSVKLK